MHIIFFIGAMHYGGAAKKTSMIANELCRRGNRVSIVTDLGYQIGFDIDPNISIWPLYEDNEKSCFRFANVVQKLKRVRSIVTTLNPDIIVTVLPHVSFYVKIALLGIKTPIVFSDETSFARKDSRFVHFIRHCFYNTANAVVVLTENDVRLLGKNIPQKVAIHNPVVCPEYKENYYSKRNTILVIGPLNEWYIKGFDLLFCAFQSLVESFPMWNIAIAGDDREPYRSKVIELIKNAGIYNNVRLLGYRTDIFNVMADSSIYAMSSRVEGFSLALIEAISQRCACVAFSNHGVMKEVSCGGKGVLIVEDGDVDAFSESLRLLMSDSELRKKIADEGIKCVKEYDLNLIVDKWELLLNRVANK